MIDPGIAAAVQAIGTLIRMVISWADELHQRDAVIMALDAAMTVARAKTDRDLLEKHRDPA